MHISLLPTSTPPEAGPRQALLERNLVWLREELEGSLLPEQKAAIRHQIGSLEQLAGRDSNAVRELLAAVNSLASFKEPLEALIILIERHRSFKNLPTLLEHLCRTADSAEEMSRAQLLSAWFSILHARDDTRALAAVESALEASPADPAALLTLELLSRRLGNTLRLRHALEGRRAATSHPLWSQLLSLDLADSYASTREYERANALLEGPITTISEVTFQALDRRAEWGRASKHPEWEIEALRAQAALIIGALNESTPGAAARVPASMNNPSRAVATLLDLARLEHEQGRHAAALVSLERASTLAPKSAVVACALMQQAEKAGRHAILEAVALSEIEASPTVAETAALWVRVAESRMTRNEPGAAIEALQHALTVDPECWVARARELDLLRGTRDAAGYARALQRVALTLGDPSAQRRYWLLAADAWARQAQDRPAASAALDEAEKNGVPSDVVRRVERAIAGAAGDAAWYAAATRQLLNTALGDQEKASLGLESWRLATLRGDHEEGQRLLDLLDTVPEGRLAVRVLRAYTPMFNGNGDAAGGAMLSLAELQVDPTRAAALHWALALRHASAGEGAKSLEVLREVHARQPQVAAVAGTLYAVLARQAAGAAQTSEVLRATAGGVAEDAFAASLYIEAGIRSWQAGERSSAAKDFESAERRGAGCAWALSRWVRRAAVDTLSLVDDAQTAEPTERLLNALQRTAQTATPTLRQLNELGSALRSVGVPAAPCGADPAWEAALLLALLLGHPLAGRTDASLLDRFAMLNSDCSRLADAWRYLDCIAQAEPSAKSLEESTRKWCESSPGLPAALEWTAATQRGVDPKRECEARRRLSQLVTGPVAEACASSAALVAHLSQTEPAPLLPGTSPQLRMINLETSPPGCDPRRRALALDGVAELLEDGSDPIVSLLKGYNQLAFGDAAGAVTSFRRYVGAFPNDPSGWEGLLAAARHENDPALLAEATAALGNTSRDPPHAARLFEEAASIFFDPLNDPEAGKSALVRAVELDISRSSSFQRLFDLMLDSADAPGLLALIAKRLPVASAPDEIVMLNWERARLLRQINDTEGALAALDAVLARKPDHIGALALCGEIYVTTQRYSEAASKLAEVAARSDAPAAQRLTSGLAAVDLFENQLSATREALQVLLTLHRAGLSTLPVRERLARSAAKGEAWDDAVVVLEELMFERNTPEERVEAARLALAIHRDRRHDPLAAGPAAEVLLSILPDDAEALDLALSGSLDPQLTHKLLDMGRSALISRLRLHPIQIDLLKRVARIAERSGDIELRQTTLGALALLGHGSNSSRAELATLDQRITATPPVAISKEALAQLADPEDHGPIAELLAQVAPYISVALGPTLGTFQVTKRERILASSGLPVRNEVAAWVGAFALDDFELYLSATAADRVTALATEPLSVIIGPGATAPLGSFQRQGLARALYALQRGLGVLVQLEEADVSALVAALCNLAGFALDAPIYARQRDFERQLSRVLPRRLRKLLPGLAQAVRDAETSVPTWVGAALGSLDRAAAVATGDVSAILPRVLGSPRLTGAEAVPPPDRARRLLSFVFSAEYATLRQQFGVRLR